MRVGAHDVNAAYAYTEYGLGGAESLAKCPWTPLYCPGALLCIADARARG